MHSTTGKEESLWAPFQLISLLLTSCPYSSLQVDDKQSITSTLRLFVRMMQALKEAYLPESGIWIAKYPFVDRDVFLDISLDIARAEQGL